MQIEWMRLNAFSKNKNIGIQSTLVPYSFKMKVKETFNFKNLRRSILDKRNFIIFMKFFHFHFWTFLWTTPHPQLFSCLETIKLQRKIFSIAKKKPYLSIHLKNVGKVHKAECLVDVK